MKNLVQKISKAANLNEEETKIIQNLYNGRTIGQYKKFNSVNSGFILLWNDNKEPINKTAFNGLINKGLLTYGLVTIQNETI